MKNFVIAFCVFLVWSFFGLWLYYWLQDENNQLQSKNIERVKNDTPALDTLSISEATENIQNRQPNLNNTTNAVKDSGVLNKTLNAYTPDGDILFSYAQTIEIAKNIVDVSIPQATKDFKYKLNNYFVEHPNTELHITSQYSAEENTISPNIGIQRGNKLKNILVETGIPATNIVVKPHITPIDFKIDGTYSRAFSFLFQPLNLERLEAIKNNIPETKIIYPRFSTSGVLQSPELETLLAEVKVALDNNPDVTVEVIGHTDNVGNANDNYHRGLEFARQVRWYLVAKGPINRNRIRASSLGESEAIASNNTEKGRNLNQRIEIRFTD
ncbi:OmpA family protein [Rasiella rasia]|uniref:OmpA family protein n=1 Tax=Rasiella rasia TaxID=2744027 RepID=A0A6G6GIW8_9FLAO|nr:OmpA family protein [Rasiella rasia]QIE58467.1 OmpA family protein [Rasiella rasia]